MPLRRGLQQSSKSFPEPQGQGVLAFIKFIVALSRNDFVICIEYPLYLTTILKSTNSKYMFDYRLKISGLLCCASFCVSTNLNSGIYTGIEIDAENTRLLFVGGQTSGDIYLNVFAADLEYEYIDNSVLAEVDTKILNVGLGLQLGSNKNYSIVFGPSYNDKTERLLTLETNEEHTGGFIQFGANATIEKNRYEFLASYSSLDSFLWSRTQYKRYFSNGFSAGAEMFLMGNDDGNSWGAGLLFGYSGVFANAGVKAGYKRSTNEESGSYAGLEFYFPF